MYLFVTIDTEEDNWGDSGQVDSGLENIDRLPYLQELFDKYDVKPTYLITYPVATNSKTVAILKKILDSGRCEIGAHCHPWNTPPVGQERSQLNSRLYNLSKELQLLKLEHLHKAISENFGITPTSFRAGRWGYSKDVAINLLKLGYRVDTSLASYTHWAQPESHEFINASPRPFVFYEEHDNGQPEANGLLEIPASVGFLQGNFEASNNLYNLLARRPLRYFKLIGLFNKLRILNKSFLTPEISSSKEMIQLAKQMKNDNYTFINMFFHSSTLKHGLTPFVKTVEDEKKFIRRIKEFLIYTKDAGIESITLSDSVQLFKGLKG